MLWSWEVGVNPLISPTNM